MRTSKLSNLLGGAAIALTAGFAVPAFAGDCPADKVQADDMKQGATEPKGVTDDVLTAIDLSSKGKGFAGQMFRMRQLVVQPGGVVPQHSHELRPAIIYIVEGEITEYRSTCSVPIDHIAGEATAEFGALSHWWRNNTDKPTVLVSADLPPVANDDGHSM